MLALHLSISNGFVSSKIYDKRDEFDFDMVNFPFLEGDVPRRPSYGVHILSQTPNAMQNEADFDRSKLFMRAKMTQYSQKSQ